MSKLLSYSLLIILSNVMIHTTQFEMPEMDFNGFRSCKSLTICDCLQPTDSTLPVEIHCPDFSDDQMQLYYRLNASLLVQCLPPLNWNDYNNDAIHETIHEALRLNGNISHLKRVHISQVEDVKVSHCDLTMSNQDLESLILITKPKYLSLRSNILSDTLLLSVVGTNSNSTQQSSKDPEENLTNRSYDSIETLNLENNNLMSIPYHLFTKLPNLRYISLNFNKITNVTQKFDANTLSLELAQNNIKYIHRFAFSGLQYLRTLHLWGNIISNVQSYHFIDLENLQSLELSRNLLQSLAHGVFSHLKSLKTINLESNVLQNLPKGLFAQNLQLESVRLARNERLTELPDSLFANLPNLKNIHLNSCRLTRLGRNIFDNSFSIEVIYLNENVLENLDAFVFKGLRKLRVLNIADNLLKQLPERLFEDLVNLNDLDLSGNLLKVTSSDVLKEITSFKAELCIRGNYSDIFS